ncbi:zinc finger MYND domain-containing protein 12 [Melanotaenia boesemani]|uniref:zinc finger MYND domain-containing protein 12 n=1 Tax=Melanotaenia boesemani TaxID=1250792 RepID=UPI001C055A92|nr:zinc finger MYND domain-containing protein 12 [Melanotaenia boesemani]
MDAKLQLSASKVIPIAFPKGREKFCEVCQQAAYLQCTKCKVTFYCHADHQQTDWVAIHGRICQLLVPIRTSALALQQSSHVENQIKKAELIEICRLVAQGKLLEGKHQEALLAAQFCLRCSIDFHGPCTVQLVPAYLLLAEANMGLDDLALVAEHLSLAEWVVLKNPECGLSVRHRLHRSLGRLHTATGNLEEALFHFSNDIYLASEEYGLDSTVLCGGYFLMANVFVKQGKIPVVHSLYSEISNTWHSHLTKLLETHMQSIPNPANFSASPIDHAQQTELDKMLRAILEFEQNDCRKDSAQIALVAHCLAMLWFIGGDSLKAGGFASTALQASQLIPEHDLTEPIQGLLQLVQNQQTDAQPGSH